VYAVYHYKLLPPQSIRIPPPIKKMENPDPTVVLSQIIVYVAEEEVVYIQAQTEYLLL
jgi:hypothetical protein